MRDTYIHVVSLVCFTRFGISRYEKGDLSFCAEASVMGLSSLLKVCGRVYMRRALNDSAFRVSAGSCL